MSVFNVMQCLKRTHILNMVLLKIQTIDRFLGQQVSIVVLSMTGTNNYGFLVARDRQFVAFSRAQNGLIAIGAFSKLMISWKIKLVSVLEELVKRFQKQKLYTTYELPSNLPELRGFGEERPWVDRLRDIGVNANETHSQDGVVRNSVLGKPVLRNPVARNPVARNTMITTLSRKSFYDYF